MEKKKRLFAGPVPERRQRSSARPRTGPFGPGQVQDAPGAMRVRSSQKSEMAGPVAQTWRTGGGLTGVTGACASAGDAERARTRRAARIVIP